jgi:hypothetical protein
MMNDHRPNVLAAFELLHEQLEAGRDLINLAGSQAFRSGSYDNVREYLQHSEVLSNFLDRTSDLGRAFAIQTAQQVSEEEAEQGVKDRHRNLPQPTSEARPPRRKAPPSRLCVTFDDGTVIEEPDAAGTLASTIRRIGPDRVASLGITVRGLPLVGPTKGERYKQRLIDGRYITVHSSTKEKKETLEDISKKLGVSLTVEIV